MADPQTVLTDRFRRAIVAAFGPAHEKTDPLIRSSANEKFGDYQANVAMSLAKTLGSKPRDVAQKILDKLDIDGVCERTEIAGPGFINLHLSNRFVAEQAAVLFRDPERLGVEKTGSPQTVVVDYSGPNVAKEMHVGHLRSTIIGDAITRILSFLGHKVIRQNHLGDWGTQFGMLIEHLTDSGLAGGGAVGIRDLNAFYQKAKKRFDSDPAFAERARQRVVALQGGDRETLALWRSLIDESERHFDQVYERLGVLLAHDDLCPESFYNPRLAGVVDELMKNGVAKISDGAACVFPPGFKTAEDKPQPLIIRKSDGGYGYGTTDLAALRYRIKELGAAEIIYVVDSRQKQHLAMVFKSGEMAGWVPPGVRVEHVAFGTILGEDNKPFKTRSGDTVKLIDLLEEAEGRALRVISEKNPELPAEVRGKVAHAIGIGAVKYADLCNDRIKDYVFSWDRMLAFEGNTAPYLQNAYVRIRSIFRKAAVQGIAVSIDHGQPLNFTESVEKTLALKFLSFPSAVYGVADSLEPHRLCTYLYELASLYHQFYEKCPVLTAPDEATRRSRLVLSDLTARTLAKGLELLGINVVEQM